MFLVLLGGIALLIQQVVYLDHRFWDCLFEGWCGSGNHPIWPWLGVGITLVGMWGAGFFGAFKRWINEGTVKPKSFAHPQGVNGELKTLPFKSNQAAFEYACKFMDCTLAPDVTLPALVIDAQDFAGTEAPVHRKENGIQSAVLKVASNDGGFIAYAETLKASAPDLKVDDFVALQIGPFVKEIASAATDERTGWTGIIVGLLEPTLEINKGNSFWRGVGSDRN